MSEAKNELPPDFLSTYRFGKADSTVFIPLTSGYLRLRYGLYDTPETLSLVSFVLDANDTALAVGPQLEFRLPETVGIEEATFVGENAVSGLQWAAGRVIWGHAYDDDSAPEEGETIGFDEWVDRCILQMVNPGEVE